MIDPVRFKKILVVILKILIVVELVGAFWEGTKDGQWGRFGFDLIVAGVLYVLWGRIVLTARRKKEQYRQKIERDVQDVGLWEAFIFSLLASDEIYAYIPPDRKRLVVISYTLIAFGLVALYVEIGSGLMPLVIAGALVLGAVNLLTWVVSVERGEKETLQTELAIAHRVQTSLMPSVQPQLDGFDIACFSIAAKEVGGDHFDYGYLGEGKTNFGIAVFDVSGKGMEAAMAAVYTSGAFRSLLPRSNSPAAIVTQLNTSIAAQLKPGHFVAFVLAGINPVTKVLRFANAGQTQPLLKRGVDAHWVDPAGVTFPLGIRPEHIYAEREFQLEKNDILCLLTDGFTEAMNRDKEPIGPDSVATYLAAMQTESLAAQQILEAFVTYVGGYAANAPQHDDMTIVVVKVL